MANSSLPIAVQLYTLRNLTLPFPELLAQVAAIGYTGVETTSNHGCTIDEMRALLDKNQLKVVSAHVIRIDVSEAKRGVVIDVE